MTSGPAIRESEQPAKTKVFISYSRKDMAFVDRLDSALKMRGFETLIDRADIFAFEEWWKRIEGLISRADTIVFVLSPDSVVSDVAQKEIAFAASLNKRLAPVVYRRTERKVIPEVLAQLNFIYFDDEARFEESADRLADALNTNVDWVRQHTEFGEQARRWFLAKGPNGLLLRSPLLDDAERWIAGRPPGAPLPTEQTQTFVRRSRQAVTRRRKVLTGSLAGGMVIALALAGLAYWQREIAVEQTQIAQERRVFSEQQKTIADQQRQIAIEQRAIAEKNEAQAKAERDKAVRNFKLAHRTAESLVFDIAQGLREVEGMRAEMVRKILETAREAFEQLAVSAPEDQALQRSRAAMLDEFGNTYLTVGDLDQALKAYSDALVTIQRLAVADVGNAQWQRDLSISYSKVGAVLQAHGRLEDALTAYRESLAIRERLAAADRNNAAWQRDLAVAQGNVGDLLVAQRRFDEALRVYIESLTILQQLAGPDDNSKWQRDLSIAYEKLGNVLMEQGRLDEGLKAYRDSLTIRERLVAADRSNAQMQRGLSIAYEKVGDVLVTLGRPDEALKVYREGFVIMERLAAADRSNSQWQRDLAVTHWKLAVIYEAQARIADALVELIKGRDIVAKLVASAPGNTQFKKDWTLFDRQMTLLQRRTKAQ